MLDTAQRHGYDPKIMNIHKSIAGRIRVARSGCWVWTGARAGKGYGQLRVHKRHVYAHRLMFEHAHGPIPGGMCVLHHCDNPPCCNPEHLFLGTHKTNAMDAKSKGRTLTGLRNRQSKLTPAKALLIRALYAGGLGRSQADLGAMFGVSAGAISKCVRLRTWDASDKILTFSRAPKPRLTKAQEEAVRQEYAAGGATYRALAAKHGCSYTLIRSVVHGATRYG